MLGARFGQPAPVTRPGVFRYPFASIRLGVVITITADYHTFRFRWSFFPRGAKYSICGN